MNRPRLLDLGCKAGGASMGYSRAGFDVTGVDIDFQPNYPFRHYRADMFAFLEGHGREYDVIHVSPPCQGYSSAIKSTDSPWTPSRGHAEPRLITEVHRVLQDIGKPYVIENVIGSQDELKSSLLLCGSMFGLLTPRHRIFEVSHLIFAPTHTQCRGMARREASRRGWEWRDMSVTGKGRRAGTTRRWQEIMGIDWQMTQFELAEAIPPAYTEYIGRQLMRLFAV